MYALIYKGGHFLGVFSSKKSMKNVIEAIIKNQYEIDGYHGNYNFRYIKFNPDEPWLTKDGENAPDETYALFTFYTMHSERFTHKVKTDWSTGEILDMDADDTSN